VERALTLDPDLAIALSTRGAVRFFFGRNLDVSADDLSRALALLPSYSLAMLSLANVCAVRWQFDEAAAWMDQALLVDPLDVGINMNVGDHAILRRSYTEAVQALERALALSPGHRPCQLRLSWALALAGVVSPAVALLSGIGPAGEHDAQWHEYSALVASAAGDVQAATRHFAALQSMDGVERVPAWSMARAAAAAGRVDSTLAYLNSAAEARSSSMPFLMVTPAFDVMHADPRFIALGKALRLPAEPSERVR